jgi:hypothetical protein
MTSDLYTIDYDEEGVAYQVRRVWYQMCKQPSQLL